MILVILGATGIGKSDLARSLVSHYNAEIINADAFSLYKGMDIGTAKDKGIKLNDIYDFRDNISVLDYQKIGRDTLDNLISQNKNIIIVGGSGLYIKSLLYDYRFNKDKDINLEGKTLEELVKMIPPDARIDLKNKRRVVRYLKRDGETKNKDIIIYPHKIIYLKDSREDLYNNINKRVDLMIRSGLEDEVRSLYNIDPQARSINQAIGYKEFIPYFKGEISLEEVINNIKRNTRRLAKKQETFFNNQFKNTNVFYKSDNLINEIITNIDNDMLK